MFRTQFLLSTTTILLSFSVLPSAWAAGSITNVGYLGGLQTGISGISADGLAAAGDAYDGLGGNRAFYWTSTGGMIDIGDLGGGAFAFGLGLSGDGSTVIGYSMNPSFELEAYRWTAGGGMIGLGNLGGGYSQANAVNYDGSVIVGESDNGAHLEAFRWTAGGGMVGLGDLGGNSSFASGLNADGSVVVGASINGSGNYEAFRWTSGTGMVGLGTLGGADSSAFATSADGSIIVGQADNASGNIEAFRWESGTMIGLGMNGGTFSYAADISDDGSIIYANSDNGVFRWTAADGPVSLDTLIASAGIDMTGWTISEVRDINSDGTILAGGADFNGVGSGFILTLIPGAPAGIITPGELEQSLLPTLSPAQQSYSLVSNGIGQSLLVARNALTTYFPGTINVQNPASIAPSAGDGDRLTPYTSYKPMAFYTTGNVGFGQNNDRDNHAMNGSAGLLFKLNNQFVLGGGLVMGHSTEDTHLDGESKVDGTGISLNTTYESDLGLRVYATVAASKLNVDSKRNYLNGASLDSSSGETEGYAYGTAVRLGYELPHDKDAVAFMPYTELQYSRSKLNAYTETGGAFPADISKQTGKSFISLLGLEASKAVTPKLTVRGRGAWGHRYTDDNQVTVTAASITQTLTGDGDDKNWAEMGMTVNYKLSDDTTISADIQGRSGKTSDPQINVGVGLVWNF